MHKSYSFSEKGFSLTSMIIAMAILALATLAIVSAASTQMTTLKRTQKAADRLNLANFVIGSILNESICSCHVNGSVNTAMKNKLRINTNTKKIKDIEFQEWRSSCDFSATDNILATAGSKLAGNMGDLYVEAVTLRKIRQVEYPHRYFGELAIEFTQTPDEPVVLPVTASFGFEIDTASGSPATRPISNCFQQEVPKVIESCPAGFELIGIPGNYGNFCIEINERPPKSHNAAIKDCVSLETPDDLWSELCFPEDLGLACSIGTQMTGKTNNWELHYWGPSSSSLLFVALGAGCASEGLKKGTTAPYRCCMY